MSSNGYKARKNSVRFSSYEDALLKSLVSALGEGNWCEIAKHFSSRNAKRCKERWYQYLSPDVNKDPWTVEEENKLLDLAQKHNKRWIDIAKMFNRRTAAQIRNKWRTLQRRINTTNEVAEIKKNEIEPEEKAEIPDLSFFIEEDVFDLFSNRVQCSSASSFIKLSF